MVLAFVPPSMPSDQIDQAIARLESLDETDSFALFHTTATDDSMDGLLGAGERPNPTSVQLHLLAIHIASLADALDVDEAEVATEGVRLLQQMEAAGAVGMVNIEE